MTDRKQLKILLIIGAIFICGIFILGETLEEFSKTTDFANKNLPPTMKHIFGTDWMGRDMFARTIVGLSLSLKIGVISAGVSTIIAVILGTLAAIGGKVTDGIIGTIIDGVMGIPHILLLILISFAFGRGFTGVVVGIAFTHWTSLSRLLRGEVLQLRQQQYIKIAKKLGESDYNIVKKHMMPHLIPQIIVGFMLLFPHAILHEASITFLGFGIDSSQAVIGVILSESMQYLVVGYWWLAVFPGLALAIPVSWFYITGNKIRDILVEGMR